MKLRFQIPEYENVGRHFRVEQLTNEEQKQQINSNQGLQKCVRYGNWHAPKSIGGRNAGEEHAGTQGWVRTAQVAMLPSAGGDFESSLLTQAGQALPGQSHLRRGQLRLVGRKIRWLLG
jgi:phage terminase large subunit-like protein